MRVLGIDYGKRKIGLALGDTESRLASPWTIIQNTSHGEVVKQVKLICERESAERVVLGLPRPLRDAELENKQVQAVRLFADDLRSLGIPVDEWDERLTSAEAQHYVQRGQDDDAVAASIMLQSYLDRSEG
ncbi:MAG TPA: Holliday junction resolvase RuvX [Elusimicrobiales bacterium]|nr:Holliday junction resolvase RuvX [Elusimicrobiales bacterium]